MKKLLVLISFFLILGCTSNQDSVVNPVPPTSVDLTATITVSKNEDLGTLTGDVTCAEDCASVFLTKNIGETVTVTATPKSGYYLESWSLPSCGTNVTCSLIVMTSMELTANFKPLVIEELDFSVDYFLHKNKERVTVPIPNPNDYDLVNTYFDRHTYFMASNAHEIHLFQDSACTNSFGAQALDQFGRYAMRGYNGLSSQYTANYKVYYKYKNTVNQTWSECLSKTYKSTYQPLGYNMKTQDYSDSSNSGVVAQFKESNGALYALMQYLPKQEEKTNWLYKFNETSSVFEKVNYEGEPLIVFNQGLFSVQDRLVFVGSKSSASNVKQLFEILPSGTVQSSLALNSNKVEAKISQYNINNTVITYINYKNLAPALGEGDNSLDLIVIDSSILNVTPAGRFVTSLKFFSEGIVQGNLLYFPNEASGLRNGVLKFDPVIPNSLLVAAPKTEYPSFLKGLFQITLQFDNRLFSYIDDSARMTFVEENREVEEQGYSVSHTTFFKKLLFPNSNPEDVYRTSENSFVSCSADYEPCSFEWLDSQGERSINLGNLSGTNAYSHGTRYDKNGDVIVSHISSRKQINTKTKEVKSEANSMPNKVFNNYMTTYEKTTIDGSVYSLARAKVSLNEQKTIYKGSLYVIQGDHLDLIDNNNISAGLVSNPKPALIKIDEDNNRFSIASFCGSLPENNDINLFHFKGKLFFNTPKCSDVKHQLNIYEER